uniref:Uncharacterized protein n=1 Tax=Acrobeloides nanus TaxID=290746 RepID=A0A914E0T1_9BILA
MRPKKSTTVLRCDVQNHATTQPHHARPMSSETKSNFCSKPDGPVPTGQDLLEQARADKKIIELIEEIDLSEDENNNVYDSEASVDG